MFIGEGGCHDDPSRAVEGEVVDPMDQTFIRQTLIDRMRRHSESVDQAARSMSQGMGISIEDLTPAVESIRREGRKNMLLETPSGVYDSTVAAEARMSGWYTGPEAGDEFWPRLRSKLESSAMRDVVNEIDRASTKVVANLADPHIRNLSKRGLVIGYVQSGKTANYTAVMAKAADAGYRLFVVLAGMHNNLRRQTQVRLSRDLVDHDWAALTTDDADFGNVVNGAAMLNRGVHAIAVVKKNQARLRSLRDWLRDIPRSIRERVPVLILDDEADQATPNSAAAADQLTKINQLVREIWAEVPTGTYLGYTATPFANIFMDPHDEEELYPSDFIIDLPRPKDYFGAERLFGREPLDDADDPDLGLDMVRVVPDDEAEMVRPPSGKDQREGFNPELQNSLIDAVLWFVVATAIRRARGQSHDHSSMLVHTTHFVSPHFAMKARLDELLGTLRRRRESGDLEIFRQSFNDESGRAATVATSPLPEWDAVASELQGVLESCRVLVDNGNSLDRLDYGRVDEATGGPIPETVIAVGGGTLSRGLTLEGLIVSYFTRTSNTYDTLLQMGRWFGYRPGYEDLPRIWMQASLADEFRFLALIEEEIRRDMQYMERLGNTPRELGVRVRAHPGRLAIVAKNKMRHADVVRVSYSGQRLQTFILHETDNEVIRVNQEAARSLIHTCLAETPAQQTKNSARWLFKDIGTETVVSLLNAYKFHPDQVNMRADHMIGWLRRAAEAALWNVAVVGSDHKFYRPDGSLIELGSLDLGLDRPVPTVNRAPLDSSSVGTANIKALLSHYDWFLDLDRKAMGDLDEQARRDPREVRRRLAEGRGLVIVYPISKSSTPIREAVIKAGSRRDMHAPDHLVGIGLIFPETDRDGMAEHGTYYSVHPDWEIESESDDDIPEDRESDTMIDGQVAGRP